MPLLLYRARPPFVFGDSTKELTYISRQLAVLRADQLWRLVCWLSPFGLSEEETRCVNTATDLAKPPRKLASELARKPRQPFAWNTYGLHCIYKCISQVAGLLSTNHPTEFRDILQVSGY